MAWSTSGSNRRQTMAQPIAFHAPANHTASNTERLRNAPAEHAEALLSAYELLQLLHDRGVLNLLRGLVGSGDEVIGTITAAVDKPESIRSIRNFLLLTQFFAGIPPEVPEQPRRDCPCRRRKGEVAQGPWVTEFVQAFPRREQPSRH